MTRRSDCLATLREAARCSLCAHQQEFSKQSAKSWQEWQDDIPSAIKKHEGRITKAGVDLRAAIYVYALYFWHSEGMPARNKETVETMWKSMIG